MNKTKTFLAISSLVLLAGSLASCGGNDQQNGVVTEDDTNKHVTFNVWMPLKPWSIASFSNRNFGENEVIKEIEKKFNVSFNFTHPATGSEVDQFSLMVAGNELPDLIFSPSWYAGGIETGIRDGVYFDFTDYLAEYCPNYKKVIDENEEIRKIITTDSGRIASFHSVSLYEEYPYYGPLFKAKWLQDVGESVPVTIDDWERVLTKFKTEKGATAPFILDPTGYDFNSGTFLTAYGVAPSFYLDYPTNKARTPENATIKFGPNESGFYSYLNKMRDWILKGLIDPNFNEKDWNDELNQIQSSASGVIMQSPDTMSVYFDNAGIKWVAADFPKLNANDEIHWRQKTFQAKDDWMETAAIAPTCKHISRLLKVLDYGYSEEGSTLFNYGIKDRTYTVNETTGEKEFTDLIYNNQYGLTPTQCVWKYKVHDGLFIRDEHHANPILINNPQSLSTRQMWSQTDTDAVVPPLTYSKRDAQDVGADMAMINQYIQTQVLSFLTGGENDLSGRDNIITDPSTFRSKLNAKGLGEVLAICNASYQNYLSK